MKKPIIKINFLYYGTPFDLERNFFYKILKKKYNVKISKDPDYVFFSVYWKNNKFLREEGSVSNPIISKERKLVGKLISFAKKFPSLNRTLLKIYSKITFKLKEEIPSIYGDFVKIFYTSETIKPDMSKCDWAFASQYEDELNDPKYTRVPPYILSGDLSRIKRKKQTFDKIKKEKINFCNFLYNNQVKFRNNFFTELSKYKKIDSPGSCMRNMSPLGNHKNADDSRGSSDWVDEKLEFLSKYKFTIGFESKCRSGWITEKLVDPLRVNSVPIYFGPKDVGKDFNTKAFINYHDFKNMKEFIRHVIEVDNNESLYKKYLREPIFKNNVQKDFADYERFAKKLYSIIDSRR